MNLAHTDTVQNWISQHFASQGVMSNHVDLFSRCYCRLPIHLSLFGCQLCLNKGEQATIDGATKRPEQGQERKFQIVSEKV